MPERTPTLLALGFAALSWILFAASWYWSTESGWKVLRLLGFSLGGLASVPTLILCIYYLRSRQVQGVGVKIATAVSGVYAVPFVLFFIALMIQHPLAAKWAAYAF